MLVPNSIIKEMVDLFNNNATSDDLMCLYEDSLVEEGWDHIYANTDESLNDVLGGCLPSYVLKMVCMGEYVYEDTYFMLTGSGNLKSADDIEDLVDIYDLAESVIRFYLQGSGGVVDLVGGFLDETTEDEYKALKGYLEYSEDVY